MKKQRLMKAIRRRAKGASKPPDRGGTRPGAGAANRRGASENQVPPSSPSVDGTQISEPVSASGTGPISESELSAFAGTDGLLGLLPDGSHPAAPGPLLPVYGSREADELPRCVHGNCLRDGSGEALEPPCGCGSHNTGGRLPSSDAAGGGAGNLPALVDEFIAWVEEYAARPVPGEKWSALTPTSRELRETALFARVVQALRGKP